MQKVDVEQVLTKLSDLDYIRLGKRTGNWYSIYCPFHSNGQEKKPSCGVLLNDEYRNGTKWEAGMFHCFACSYSAKLPKAVADILANNSVKADSIQWLSDNIPGFVYEKSEEGNSLIDNSTVVDLLDKFAADNLRMRLKSLPTYISEEELASYRYTVPYMYERKLTDAVIAKYDVGYDANHVPPGRKQPLPCVTFPVRDLTGGTLFFCRRSIVGKYFNYPEGVTKPVYGLYELPKGCKSVVVCESVFNALTAVVYGYNAVALLGTGNTYQIDQLKKSGIREFVLCLDNDDAGRKGVKKLKKALGSTSFVWVATVPEGKDLNDLTKEEFDEVYRNKE